MKALIPFLIMAICGGAYYLYISPILGEITPLKLTKAQYANVLEKTEEIKTQRDALLEAYSNISPDDTKKLGKILPERFDQIIFVNDLSTIATRYGFVVKDYRAEASTKSTAGVATEEGAEPLPSYRIHTVSFSVSGSYDQFLKFVKDMEDSLQLMDISDLSIRASVVEKDKSTEIIMMYLVKLHTYSLK